LGSVQLTYDANGNLLYDGINTYAWDADANSITISNNNVGNVGLTFDAFDRMVEQSRGSSYTQVVYGPGGGKLALMNGQSLVKGFVPLPAGETAVYTSGPALSYFRHGDSLGSSRLTSTVPGRSVYYDGAYAPYGENYAWTGTADLVFAGMDQDTLSVDEPLYDALYREYNPWQGRWVSPDPAGLGAVDPTNPQSWNRYAYVTNNPLALTDPSGLDPMPGGETLADYERACDSNPGCMDWYGSAGPWPNGIALGDYQMLGFGDMSDPLDPCSGITDAECQFPNLPGAGLPIPPGMGGGGGGGGSGTSIPGLPGGSAAGNSDFPNGSIVCSVVGGVYTCTIASSGSGNGAPSLPSVIAGGLAGAIWALLPKGYYWNPIDQATNPYHSGQWSLRQVFQSVCSTHVTVNQATGQVTSHVDTINPVPGWAILVPALAPTVWGIHFAGHALFDMGGLYPASEACM
jgi:RHS repeat-associated protein